MELLTRMSPRARVNLSRAALACGFALATLLTGCAHTRKWQPEVSPETMDDMTFQAYMANVPVVTVDEACRAMLILADGEDKTRSWEERREVMLQRGLLRPAWGLHPNHMIDRGSLAYMVCKICRITGGLNRIALGSWGLGDRRYAHRELVYRKMMPEGSDYQPVTGGEMVSLLGKADALMEEKGLYETEQIDIGEEPDLGKAAGT